MPAEPSPGELDRIAEPDQIAAAWRKLELAALKLRRLGAAERAARLGDWCRGWLDPADSYRREALERLPAATGFGAADIARALDAAFEVIDRRAILAVLERELGRSDALERWAPDATGALTRACPPERMVAVMAGNVPTAGLPVIVASLAVGAPLLVRCSRREPHFVPLVAASLAERLGWADAVVPAWWPHGSAAERAALAAADAAVLFGADQTIAQLRQALGAKVRLLPYGHRFSLAALDWNRATDFPGGAPGLADAVAHDVAAFERAGCLSPLAIYVEGDAAACAAELAGALARLDAPLPGPGADAAAAGDVQVTGAAQAPG
ncbi:MAG TPA: acyl-CoA reductase, partial [Limnochordia bacterium]|nr:acyl-CoA reductase [Limnochordia bacterium]